MRIVFAAPSLRPEAGGPATIFPAIGAQMAACGADVAYLTAETDRPAWREIMGRGQARIDLIASFGIWTPFNHLVAREAARRGVPIVVSPMGMLDPWSLGQKWLKKRVAWHAYQRRDLRRCTALHAASSAEAGNLAAIGLGKPILVVPCGVDVPTDEELGRIIEFEPKDKIRTVLFLSRIHPKKGIADLIAAWAELRPEGWRLVIAGPDADGHRAEIETLIGRHGLAGVEMPGAAFGADKSRLLASADIFVLPSYAENFGVVVAEALAHGKPVITTTATPWSELAERGCGWWIEPGAVPLRETLRAAMALSPAALATMGKAGRRLVSERYSWPVVTEMHLSMYRWAAFGGAAPTTLWTVR